MSELPIAMTRRDWSADEAVVTELSEILAKLPSLKARGAINGYVVTDKSIQIQLCTEPTTKTWKRHFKKDNK
tara:strand:- start:1238 stop:1453 length:216 start_codon:yes stop_codon:yes gene_type:complete